MTLNMTDSKISVKPLILPIGSTKFFFKNGDTLFTLNCVFNKYFATIGGSR